MSEALPRVIEGPARVSEGGDPGSPKSAPRKRRRRRLLAGLGAVAVYFVSFWVVGCTDTLLLFPTTHTVRDLPEHVKRQAFTAGEKTVEVWTASTRIRLPDETQAFVLDFIPNAGRAELAVSYGLGKWEGLPVDYWAVNYPGYGGSTGPATLRGLQTTALAAYDHLAGVAGGRPIYVSGVSMGTVAALHVAANRPVAGLYLVNPPPLRELIVGKYGWWNLWLLAWPIAAGVPRELDSLANAARSTAPAVFVMSENDTLVDYRFQQRVERAYAGPRHVITLPLNHNDDPELEHRAQLRAGIEWLWDSTHTTPTPTTRPPTTRP